MELIMRRILNDNLALPLVTGSLKMTRGEDYCFKFLICEAFVFLLIGWAIIAFKCKYVY